MPWGVAAAAVGAAGSIYASKQNKKAAEAGATTQQQIDPRIASMLFGENGNNGLLSQFQGFMGQPQSAALNSYGNAANGYLQNHSFDDMEAVRGAGNSLINGKNAPQNMALGQSNAQTSQGAAQAFGTGGVAQVSSPLAGQNAGAYNKFINGDASTNPHLLNSLQAGAAATNAAFAQNQNNLTDTLQRSVLPGIKSNSIASGGFGGSRQGIAEGLAMSDYTKQLTNANTQIGLANSANMIGAQADAWNQGQNRGLSALNSATGFDLQSQLANQSADNRAREFNASAQQQANLANLQNNQFNASLQTQNNQFNAGQQTSNGQFNANLQQQANAQNNAAALGGAGLLSGNLNTALQGATNNQNFNINRAQQVAQLLAPFIGVNSSSTSTQPYYSNTAGNAIGGALGGLSLYQQFAGMNSGSSTGAPSNVLF